MILFPFSLSVLFLVLDLFCVFMVMFFSVFVLVLLGALFCFFGVFGLAFLSFSLFYGFSLGVSLSLFVDLALVLVVWGVAVRVYLFFLDVIQELLHGLLVEGCQVAFEQIFVEGFSLDVDQSALAVLGLPHPLVEALVVFLALSGNSANQFELGSTVPFHKRKDFLRTF